MDALIWFQPGPVTQTLVASQRWGPENFAKSRVLVSVSVQMLAVRQVNAELKIVNSLGAVLETFKFEAGLNAQTLEFQTVISLDAIPVFEIRGSGLTVLRGSAVLRSFGAADASTTSYLVIRPTAEHPSAYRLGCGRNSGLELRLVPEQHIAGLCLAEIGPQTVLGNPEPGGLRLPEPIAAAGQSSALAALLGLTPNSAPGFRGLAIGDGQDGSRYPNTGLTIACRRQAFEAFNNGATLAVLASYGDLAADVPTIALQRSAGRRDRPSNTEPGMVLGRLAFSGYADDGYQVNEVVMQVVKTNSGSRLEFILRSGKKFVFDQTGWREEA